MSYETLCGIASVGITVAACINYIISILRHKTKPHAFTWVIWSLVMGIIFFAQRDAGAGAGAWAAGVSAFFCCIIFVLSLFKGEKHITVSDWLALIGALAIIPLWHITHNAFLAVVLATLIDACAYYPTVRKTWIKPHEENFILYACDNIKWGFAFFAMTDYSATSLIYPIFCMIANSSLVFMILWRRHLHKVAG